MTNADSHPSVQILTLECKIGPPLSEITRTPLTHAALRNIVPLCKRYTSIDCSEYGTFLVNGREQNGEARMALAL
jgi:hypothetical protein